jgi:hypothetical protein
MLILGTGREDIDLGPIHPQDCEVCRKEQPFRLRLLYRYEHLFFVFGNARAKSYVIVCEGCGTPFRVPRKVAWKLGRLDREPIPFLRRYGCLMVFVAFLLIAAAGVFLAR